MAYLLTDTLLSAEFCLLDERRNYVIAIAFED